MDLLPYGVTPRQHAQRARWKRTRQTPAQRKAALLNFVKARVVAERTVLRRRSTCRRGHKFTLENTRIDKRNGARQCIACQRVGWAKRAAAKREARQLDILRDQLKSIGIKANQHPESAYWRDRFVAVRERYLSLKAKAAA